jgi:hypothetical protein
MICEYSGCSSYANWKRCRAHTALFVALFQQCITADEHNRLAPLPRSQMLIELALTIEGKPDQEVVAGLIQDAQEH